MFGWLYLAPMRPVSNLRMDFLSVDTPFLSWCCRDPYKDPDRVTQPKFCKRGAPEGWANQKNSTAFTGDCYYRGGMEAAFVYFASL